MKERDMEPTSNQYYGGINRRADRRMQQLRHFGFWHAGTVWTRSYCFMGKPQEVPMSTVLYAPNRVWVDMVLKAYLRRP